MTNTTMNTGAASLSDEQRTTIQHAADKLRTVWVNHTGDKESRELCHKLEAILATPTPQADAAPSVEKIILAAKEFAARYAGASHENRRIAEQEFRAAIAAGGAQEAVGEILREGNDSAFKVSWLRPPGPNGTKLYAAPLPREAATVLTEELPGATVALRDLLHAKDMPNEQGVLARVRGESMQKAWEHARAILAASNGEQEVGS